MRRLAHRLRRTFVAVAIAAVIVACTIGGMGVALRAASADRQQISLGTVETSMTPTLDGHVSVFVPLVDWRVRLLDHRAPVNIVLELRGIDRSEAGEGISSASAANQSLAELRRESRVVVERAVRRGAIVAGIGGLVGAIAAGALLTSTRLRRKWLLVAPLFGAMLAAGLIGASIVALDEIDAERIEVTPSGGNAEELPVVLRFAAQLLDVGDEYGEHYETALASVANAAEFAGREDTVDVDGEAYVISDFHDNVFVLDALEEFLPDDAVVFGAGDYVQVGARIEQRVAPRLARLGGRFIAVSGNHDTESYMRTLAEEGAEVLDAEAPTTELETLLVAGYPDPLERPDGASGAHRLRVYGEEYDAQRDAFIDWWEDLPERPDVVIVHQHGFSHRLLAHLEETGDDEPLLVLTGHDHEPHVHVDGPHAIVDAGTLGAGGLAAVGSQSASFVRLDLSGGRPVAAHVIEVEPLTGRASSERFALTGATD